MLHYGSMPNHLPLHRNFDIQLSPVAASIIDWAPKGDVSGVVSQAATASPSRNSEMYSRKSKGQSEETRRRCGLPQINSQGSIDSGCVASPARGEAQTCEQSMVQADQQEQEASFLRRIQGGALVNSYAALPFFKRGTFSVNGGFYTSLGMASGVNSRRATASHSFTSSLQRFFYASDVIQLECLWDRMQWCGLLNIVCFAWRSKAVPWCEFVGITPYTDWTMQADHLLFSWSGFWRMYVRRGREDRLRSHISLDFPSTVSSPSSGSTDESEVFLSAVKHASDTQSVATAVPKGSATESSKHVPNRKQEKPETVPATEQSIDTTHAHLSANPAINAKSTEDVLPRPDIPHRLWRVEELRGGIGFAVKNDLVSGVNVYGGCSLHTARALTISAHVDALRRACCSVTSTTDSFDFAARLRINLITWHRTELDAGCGWRPLRRVPGLTCRVSHSMGRTSVGVTVLDVAQLGAALSQAGEGNRLMGKDSVQLSDSALAESSSSSSSSLRKKWYDPYVGWFSRAGSSILGSVLPYSAGGKASEENQLPEVSLGIRERFSHAASAGLSWIYSTVHHAKFDLTIGATANQPLSKGVKCFVVVSAH